MDRGCALAADSYKNTDRVCRSQLPSVVRVAIASGAPVLLFVPRPATAHAARSVFGSIQLKIVALFLGSRKRRASVQ